MTFREIDTRGKQCVMDIVKDFYSLSKIAQSVRLGATSKTDSMLKMVRNNQLANKSWQWGDMNKGQEVI